MLPAGKVQSAAAAAMDALRRQVAGKQPTEDDVADMEQLKGIESLASAVLKTVDSTTGGWRMVSLDQDDWQLIEEFYG